MEDDELPLRLPSLKDATQLGLDEVHSELVHYGIVPTGVESNNVTILQKIYDDEYARASKDYEVHLKRQEQEIARTAKSAEIRESLITEMRALELAPEIQLWYDKVGPFSCIGRWGCKTSR